MEQKWNKWLIIPGLIVLALLVLFLTYGSHNALGEVNIINILLIILTIIAVPAILIGIMNYTKLSILEKFIYIIFGVAVLYGLLLFFYMISSWGAYFSTTPNLTDLVINWSIVGIIIITIIYFATKKSKK